MRYHARVQNPQYGRQVFVWDRQSRDYAIGPDCLPLIFDYDGTKAGQKSALVKARAAMSKLGNHKPWQSEDIERLRDYLRLRGNWGTALGPMIAFQRECLEDYETDFMWRLDLET